MAGKSKRELAADRARDREAEIRARAKAQFDNVILPSFEKAEFMARVVGGKLTRGYLEITIAVAPSEKYKAMPLTDADGLNVLFTARRARMGEARHDDDQKPKRPRAAENQADV